MWLHQEFPARLVIGKCFELNFFATDAASAWFNFKRWNCPILLYVVVWFVQYTAIVICSRNYITSDYITLCRWNTCLVHQSSHLGNLCYSCQIMKFGNRFAYCVSLVKHGHMITILLLDVQWSSKGAWVMVTAVSNMTTGEIEEFVIISSYN